jgi:hypothetical protein
MYKKNYPGDVKYLPVDSDTNPALGLWGDPVILPQLLQGHVLQNVRILFQTLALFTSLKQSSRTVGENGNQGPLLRDMTAEASSVQWNLS